MGLDKMSWTITGMQKDTSEEVFDSKKAIDIKNLRLDSDLENGTLKLVNERGTNITAVLSTYFTKKALESLLDSSITTLVPYNDNTKANVLGICVIDNYVVVFCNCRVKINGTIDTIQQSILLGYYENNNTLNFKVLFTANDHNVSVEEDKFDLTHPIQTLPLYETEDVIKVYWTDGINQVRCINIAPFVKSITSNYKYDRNDFDFVPTVKGDLHNHISIYRTNDSGLFHAGVIQYAFTYFNKYGSESNIFYLSPLYYITNTEKAGAPNETINTAFKITMGLTSVSQEGAGYIRHCHVDSTFTNIRIYSIHRTTLNATPTVKIIQDIDLSEFKEYYSDVNYGDDFVAASNQNKSRFFIDSGTTGYTIDPNILLYIGGNVITANTFNIKDNTLFLGNLKFKNYLLNNNIKNSLKRLSITCGYGSDINNTFHAGTFYDYSNTNLKNSIVNTHFKYGEIYRLGIQLKNRYNQWSAPIFINDIEQTNYIKWLTSGSTEVTNDYTEAIKYKTPIYQTDISSSLINTLMNAGYTAIRPLVVYPEYSDRHIVCQGIVNSTVFNPKDRNSNAPYYQSSWFFRPVANIDTLDMVGTNPNTNNVSLEYRHNTYLPSNNKLNCEIQCVDYIDKHNDGTKDASIYIEGSGQSRPYKTVNNYPILYSDPSYITNDNCDYVVDANTVTINSPDIEFNDTLQNINFSNYEIKFVGRTFINASTGSLDIRTSTPSQLTRSSNPKQTRGFNKSLYGNVSSLINYFSDSSQSRPFVQGGFRDMICAVPAWEDEIYSQTNNKKYRDESEIKSVLKNFNFVIYPWHRNGSLNNQNVSVDKDGNPINKSAMLQTKRLANLRYCTYTLYGNMGSMDKTCSTKDIQVFNSDYVTATKLKSGNIYYGNIDKVLTNLSQSVVSSDTSNINIPGYRIRGIRNMYGSSKSYNIEHVPEEVIVDNKTIKIANTTDILTIDPVVMKYLSTPHLICEKLTCDNSNVYIDTTATSPINYPYLYIVDVVNPGVSNPFGGTSEFAIQNNKWNIAGSECKFSNNQSITLKWTEGDTYFQRYDCLKTYPMDLNDQNCVTEILSTLLETRINLDGRYDNNRGLRDNTLMTPENFNLINPVYSQRNNYFNYTILDSDIEDNVNFPNTITWTKTKQNGETVDTWTNLTMTSTLDLDGRFGKLTALEKANDKLLALQEKGISLIKYNENVQLSTVQGMPVELANSGKVDGYMIINDYCGCQNINSIVNTPYGLFFADDINKTIINYSDTIHNIGKEHGFNSWIQNNSRFDYFKYDPIKHEVFMLNDNNCLTFSNILQSFTSFYDYNGATEFFNLLGRRFWVKDGSIYEHQAGNYGSFFGIDGKSYSITLMANDKPIFDKTFDNIEYRGDVFNSDGTLKVGANPFSTIKVFNEHQSTDVTNLTYDKLLPSISKIKFRIWKNLLPRVGTYKMDRIRNPWTKITLTGNQTTKTTIHDFMCGYTL